MGDIKQEDFKSGKCVTGSGSADMGDTGDTSDTGDSDSEGLSTHWKWGELSLLHTLQTLKK